MSVKLLKTMKQSQLINVFKALNPLTVFSLILLRLTINQYHHIKYIVLHLYNTKRGAPSAPSDVVLKLIYS